MPRKTPLLCPSAQPDMSPALLFGVVAGTVEQPRVRYLDRPLLVTDDLVQLAGPVKPTEVFRFAAPCAEGRCQHFRNNSCTLAERTVELVPLVGVSLPPCAIRPNCRWWQQEGKAACFRCPQIVTEAFGAPEAIREAARPGLESVG
jgi:hypothetical protein